MGTHPIFESDFDCLTDLEKKMGQAASVPEPVVKVIATTALAAIPSCYWCAAAIIGLVGLSAFLIYKGVKFVLDEMHRDKNIKWCKDQMSKCTDIERFKQLKTMWKTLQFS